MSLNAWRETRETAKNTILQLRDTITRENRDFNTEERAAWDKANKDFDSVGLLIEVQERGDAVSKAYDRRSERLPRPGLEDVFPKSRSDETDYEKRDRAQSVAMQSWFLRQLGKPLKDGHRRACRAIGFNPGSRTLEVRLPKRPGLELRTPQSVGTNSAGGFLAPTGFVNSLEVALKQYDAVRKVADVFRTEGGNPLPWPTMNDTTVVGTLLAENAQVSEAAATFGQKTFGAYKITSGLILVSAELDEDSAFDMTATIGESLGERLGRGWAGYHATGTGSSQPGGIVTGSTLGKTTAGAAVITADEIIDLFHSVDPAYRDNPGVGFMMHDNVAAVVRKLKDSENRYLWDLDTMRNGQPSLLLGKPVTINQSMQATVATATKTMLFGDMKKMKVRDAGPVRIRRLVERYADYDQVGFIAFQRGDSGVLNAGSGPIKHLLQA